MNELAKPEGRGIAQYNPDQGLKSIAVAEAAERHFRRAKDATHLREAIERKLKAQAEYVVWRDKYVVPSRDRGKQRKRDGVSELQPHNLPDADPGKVTIHRWRNRLCTKGRVDGSKIQRAVLSRDRVVPFWPARGDHPSQSRAGRGVGGILERGLFAAQLQQFKKIEPIGSPQAAKPRSPGTMGPGQNAGEA